MKLQYLGDVRDSFKWDLLHWLCTEAEPPYQRLLFVPLLTPDDVHQQDGRISHLRFKCRPEIRGLVASLAQQPKSFEPLRMLGHIGGSRSFEVVLYRPDAHVEHGSTRHAYWEEIGALVTPDTLVFLDPDNGFETKTRAGPKWVRHREVEEVLSHGAEVAVYQHRPQRRPWEQVFAGLAARLDYSLYAAAAYEPNLAFVLLARTPVGESRLRRAVEGYVTRHASVQLTELRSSVPIPQMQPTGRGGPGLRVSAALPVAEQRKR